MKEAIKILTSRFKNILISMCVKKSDSLVHESTFFSPHKKIVGFRVLGYFEIFFHNLKIQTLVPGLLQYIISATGDP